MNESFLPRAALSMTLMAAGIGAVAARAEAVAEATQHQQEATANQHAYLREEDILMKQTIDTDKPNMGPNLAPNRGTKVQHVTYPTRRSYGRSGQIGHRTRGDIQTLRRH